MNEYHKIQSVFKRDLKTHKFIIGDYSLPEFEYLENNLWIWTEKVDGTNVRIMWNGIGLKFGGRTDSAQMPTRLMAKLHDIFKPEMFAEFDNIILYGEGYGAGIQKVGHLYSPNAEFVLFDIKISDWWIKRSDVVGIAEKLGINVVPIVGMGTIKEAMVKVRESYLSTWGDFPAEGIVMRPAVELKTRAGNRIITKMKHGDFER